jgi:oligoendopeptidase F
MLVFALYEEYKHGGSDFRERFKRLLSRGRSMSPKDQIAELGYDISDSKFWTRGPKQAESFLKELRKLI